MNLNDNNIDQLFRKEAENMDVPEYSDTYWAEMNQLIDADAKNRKKLFVWAFSGTIGAALVVLLLFLNISQVDENISEIALEQKKHEDQHEKAIALDNTQQQIQHSDVSENNIQINSFKKKNTQPIIDNEKETGNLSNDLAKNKIADKHSHPLSKIGVNIPAVTIEKTEQYSQQNNTSKFKAGSADTPISNTEKQHAVKAILNKINKLPIKLVALKTSSEPDQSLTSIKNRMNHWRVTYHAEAALGVSESYQSNTESPWRYSLAGVIRFKYNQLVLNTGLGILVERPANLQITERVKVYGFGLENYENILNYKSFTQIYIPFEIGYKSNNSTYGIGGQIHTTVGTRMSLTSKINQVITSQDEFKNQLAGLNRYSGNFYLWIDQELTDKISAGVRVGSAIGSRISDSHYFNTVTNEQPIFGQLTLKYQLFK